MVASFDRMAIPCMPVANPSNDCSAVPEGSNDNPGATFKDSGYQSFVTTTGGSNSVSSNSTPVRRPPAEVMDEQSVHEAPWCVDSQPLSHHSALADQLQEECGVQVEPTPTVRNSVDDGPPPLKFPSLESLNSPLTPFSSPLTGMNETKSLPQNEVECTCSYPSHNPQCDKPTDLFQSATAPTSSGAGRGMLSKQLQYDLRNPKPLVPIGRGKMLLKVLEESTRTGPPVGNVDIPTRSVMPAVPTAADRADETAILKSMSKQAYGSSSKRKAVRIAAVFSGADVKPQACNNSVPVRKDQPQDELVVSEQDGLQDLPGIKGDKKHVLPALDSDSLKLDQSQSSSSFTSPLQAGQNVSVGEHDISSSPPERSYQALSSGDELEFRESRQGRSSDDLEKSIALHQRNIHRWQVILFSCTY